MHKLDFAFQFVTVEQPKIEGIEVVVVAAGSSSRMKGADKLFMPLCGIPLLARTLRALENCRSVSGITVVTRQEKLADVSAIAQKYAISKFRQVVVGGSCREESVRNGLLTYKGKAEKILIHDGARPFVTEEIVAAVHTALKTFDSVTCAVKVKDTVKEVDKEGVAVRTLRRDSLAAVQTPQGVNLQRFLEITENRDDLSVFTDDTSVMESAGIPTKVVDGDYNNIKITTPEDVAVAESIIMKEC